MSSVNEGKEILRRLLNSSKFNMEYQQSLPSVKGAAPPRDTHNSYNDRANYCKYEHLPESGYQSTNYQSTPYSSHCSSRVISNATSPIKMMPMNVINEDHYYENESTTESYASPMINPVKSSLQDCSMEDISRLMKLLELCQSMKVQSHETTAVSSGSKSGKQRDLPNMRSEDSVYNVRYKTQPCIHYQRKRDCPLGDNCHFAHGPNELRHLKTHPKYRTRPCTNFVKTGVCPFGATCSFVHPKPYVPGTSE